MIDWDQLWDVLLPLGSACILGGLVGLERELKRQAAGLRTHMMVAMAAAVFVLLGRLSEWEPRALSRVVEGVATGIGFVGAGTILKLTDRREVRGLTTASSIWLAAAIGCGVALQHYVLAVCATVFSLIVLTALRKVEVEMGTAEEKDA